jgi:hypothetical protein
MLNNHMLNLELTNAPGVDRTILFAPISWFDTIASAPNTEVTPGSDVMITGDHTFSVTSPLRGFIKLYTTDRTGEYSWKQVGDRDSRGFNLKFEAWVPYINTAFFSFVAKAVELMVLVRDVECSTTQWFQMGTACSPCTVEGSEFKTGKNGGEGKKGTNVTFEAYASKPLVYTGATQFAAQP